MKKIELGDSRVPYSSPFDGEASKTSFATGPRWMHILVLIIVAMSLTYPCIRRGLPLGHSNFTHMLYQHYFDEQIAQGDWSPHWIISLNRGLGGGVFYAQYPLPYYVPWVIGKIIPIDWGLYEEAHTQGLAIALAAILAALFAYAWCACFADRISATIAAIVYLTLPYSLTIDIYLRSAIGEFWALAFLPLSFYFIERMAAGSRRALSGLAVAFALIIISHLFTAVLLAPILVVYAIWRIPSVRRVLGVCQVFVAFTLATGLAGFYALPFLSARKFFHPENFLLTQGGNASPLSQMFTFNAHTFPAAWYGHGWLYEVPATRLFALATAVFIGFALFRLLGRKPQWLRLVLGVVAVAALVRAALAGRHVFPAGEISGAMPLSDYLIEQRAELFLYSLLTFVTASVCYWSIQNSRKSKLADLLMVLALGSYLMMTSWTVIIWRSVHFLWNIQFPWRLNTFLLAATTGLAALAISGLRGTGLRRGLTGVLIGLGIWGVVAVQAARLGSTFTAFRSTNSNPFRDEMDSAREIYMQVDPRQALLVQPPDDERVHATVLKGSGTATVQSILSRSIQIEARCATDCTIQVGQFYFPVWQVRTVPATKAELHAGLPGGLTEFSLPPGEYSVALEVPYGWSERLGLWLSFACLLLVIVIAFVGTPFLRAEPTDSSRELEAFSDKVFPDVVAHEG